MKLFSYFLNVFRTDVDTNGSQKEPVSRGAAPAGGPADRGATEGCVDRHPEVVPSHVLVVEVSLPPSAEVVGSAAVLASHFQACCDIPTYLGGPRWKEHIK